MNIEVAWDGLDGSRKAKAELELLTDNKHQGQA